MIGETIGSYTILRRLGEGGMGEVYLAEHKHIARRAAIKLLLPELTTKSEAVSRFFTEARATSLIRHPGIVEILDCAVHTNGRAYIIMEFLDGESLAHALERVGSFSSQAASALAILGQIASALSAAHAKGIVHRDLKPDNVFLAAGAASGSHPSENGLRVKILDFGIAKLAAEGQASLQRTRTGSLLGTPVYMSPEQCRGAGAVDHRSDLYSLGCIGYELFAGRPPFVKEGAGELLVAHLSEDPVSLGAVAKTVSPALSALIDRLLAKDPAQRPASALEVVQAIEGLLGVRAAEFGSLIQPPFGFPAVGGTSPAQLVVPAAGLPDPDSARAISAVTDALEPLPETVGTGGQGSGARPPVGDRAGDVDERPVGPGVTGEPVIGGGTRLLPAFDDVDALPREPKTHTTLSRTASESLITQRTRKKSRRGLWAVAGGLALGGIAAVVFWPSSAERRHSPPPTAAPAPQPESQMPASPSPGVPDNGPAPGATDPVAVPSPAPPTFDLTSQPVGAEVWIAGETAARGVTPLKLALSPGEKKRSVTVKAAGFQPKELTLEAGHEGAVSVTLAAAKHAQTSAQTEERPPKSDSSRTGEAKPGQAKPGEIKPGENRPGENNTIETKHGRLASPEGPARHDRPRPKKGDESPYKPMGD